MELKDELSRDLGRDLYDITPEGVFFPRQGIMAVGEYFDRVNGGEWKCTKNLLPTEGLASILSIAFGSTVKHSGFYLALFSGAAAPAANWTAANFASVASEIVSQTEGYTSPTRPAWTPPASVSTGSISNMDSPASFTIATASQLTVTGIGLLTASGRGATTGTLISATKYANARVFQVGDVFEAGYRISLTV